VRLQDRQVPEEGPKPGKYLAQAGAAALAAGVGVGREGAAPPTDEALLLPAGRGGAELAADTGRETADGRGGAAAATEEDADGLGGAALEEDVGLGGAAALEEDEGRGGGAPFDETGLGRAPLDGIGRDGNVLEDDDVVVPFAPSSSGGGCARVGTAGP